MSFRELVKEVASQGRGGDKHLLHINDEELQSLLETGMVTLNPKTGAYEAWKLSDLGPKWGGSNPLTNPIGAIEGVVGDIGGPGATEFFEAAGGNPLGNIQKAGQAGKGGAWENLMPNGRPSAWDYLAGGAAANNPNYRTAGRLVGSYFAGNAIGGAMGAGGSTTEADMIAAEGGGAVGTEAGAGTDAAAIDSGAVGAGGSDAAAIDAAAGGGDYLNAGNTIDYGSNTISDLSSNSFLDTGSATSPINSAPISGPDNGLSDILNQNLTEIDPNTGEPMSPPTQTPLSPADASEPPAPGSPESTHPAPSTTKPASSFFNKNQILPAVALGASLLSKPKKADTSNLEAQAASTAAAANAMIAAGTSGTLPPGAQTQVSNAVNDAINAIKSKYASMGMSGSTMETQEIASAQSRGQAAAFAEAQAMAQTGLQASGLSARIYNDIMNVNLQQDQFLQQALANFAASSAMGAAKG